MEIQHETLFELQYSSTFLYISHRRIATHNRSIDKAFKISLEKAELSNGSEYEMSQLYFWYSVSKSSKYCSLYFPNSVAVQLAPVHVGTSWCVEKSRAALAPVWLLAPKLQSKKMPTSS
mmetsp:Transcript_35338/g.85716  ORF Transcript_35338/g.85716 Transcript_35338/m.85716 type:complete len:119 (+) Transcript_35338:65-421(+)